MRPTNPDDWPEARDLQAHLARLADARAALEQATQVLHVEREDTVRSVRRFAEVLLSEGIAAPREVLRALYWDYLDIPVAAITTAFGFRETADLIGAVGPDERAALCRGKCGRSVTSVRKHRTDANSGAWRWCEICAATIEKERTRREAERLREARDEDRQRRALAEQLRDNPPPIRVQYVEYEGVPGLWRISREPEPDWA